MNPAVRLGGYPTAAARCPCLREPTAPFCQPLAPELRVRQLELGAEHVLMLCEAGQVFSWGGGR